MTRALLTALTVLALGAPAAGAEPLWAPWAPPAAQFPSTVTEKNVPITMSDGNRLYANVVSPADAAGKAASGRFPVLLTQTPYNKNVGKAASEYLVTHGYVQVIVDVRGTGSSEGTWDALGSREQRDGYELVRWAATQPFSNGSVGTHGVSYLAINSLLTAAQHPPGLKALFPVVPMADAYRDLFVQGGQANTEFASLWFGLVTSTSLVPATYAPDDPAEAARVLAQHGGGAVGYQGAQAAGVVTGADGVVYDGPTYRTRSPIELIDQIDVPAFFVGGWFDLFQRGEPLLFEGLANRGVPTRLMMGPWYHNTPGDGLPAAGTGIPSLEEIELRWMDHYVKGLPDPGLDGTDVPPVTAYENGSDRWRSTTGWPAPGVSAKALHLSGPARPGAPGALSAAKPADSAADLLPFNPATGPCTRSTAQWSAGNGAGTPCDDDSTANDLAGLSYDLPVTATTHLLGPLNAHLWVSSKQGRDGQITARVEDVTPGPGGKVTQISAGWQVLSFRALDTARSVFDAGLMLQPYHPFTRSSVQAMPTDDSPVAVDLEIFPTSWAVPAGHTLRLTLQTADTPHLAAPGPQAAASGGLLSIHHDAGHDSYLVLPVGPA